MPYLVKVIGVVDPLKRIPHPRLPEQLIQIKTYPYDDKEGLINMVDTMMQAIVSVQGMGASLDPSGMQDHRKVETNRVFVPMHMIAYIYADVMLIQGEVPMLDKDNNTAVLSGKEIVKH